MKLFIYGALKTGQIYNNKLGDSVFISAAKTSPHYMLYQPHMTNWPLLAPLNPGVSVVGELWEVSDATMASLDKLHCVPVLFQRKTVTLENNEEVTCYLIADSHMNKNGFADPIGSDWPVVIV